MNDMIGIMRSTSLDLIKIIAIYLVIVVHTFRFPITIEAGTTIDLVFIALAKTCVPLFLLISGGLLLAKKESTQVFFKKRLAKVLLPWIGWSIFAVLLSGMFHNATNIELFSETLQSYWFVVMILCLYLLTPVLRPMVQAASTTQLLYFVGLWFLTVSLLPYTLNSLAFPMIVDNGLVRQTISYSGFFLAGYILLQKWKKISELSPVISSIIVCCGLFLCVGFTIINYHRSATVTDLYYNFFAPGPVLISLGIFLLLYKYFSNIEKYFSERARQLIAIISSLSLHIYFLHEILRKFIFTSWSADHFFLAYGEALVLLIVSTLILLLARRVIDLRK